MKKGPSVREEATRPPLPEKRGWRGPCSITLGIAPSLSPWTAPSPFSLPLPSPFAPSICRFLPPSPPPAPPSLRPLPICLPSSPSLPFLLFSFSPSLHGAPPERRPSPPKVCRPSARRSRSRSSPIRSRRRRHAWCAPTASRMFASRAAAAAMSLALLFPPSLHFSPRRRLPSPAGPPAPSSPGRRAAAAAGETQRGERGGDDAMWQGGERGGRCSRARPPAQPATFCHRTKDPEFTPFLRIPRLLTYPNRCPAANRC